ncbi:MAG: hypothetical protein GF331_14025 [Chitinivibrionales bacterium]|nr:hypothetical protein [Chitinivibrionales bacterium]
MKREYDFSKADQGKFYRRKAKLNLPVYLDDDNMALVQQLARKRKADVNAVVNDMIRGDKEITKALG